MVRNSSANGVVAQIRDTQLPCPDRGVDKMKTREMGKQVKPKKTTWMFQTIPAAMESVLGNSANAGMAMAMTAQVIRPTAEDLFKAEAPRNANINLILARGPRRSTRLFKVWELPTKQSRTYRTSSHSI